MMRQLTFSTHPKEPSRYTPFRGNRATLRDDTSRVKELFRRYGLKNYVIGSNLLCNLKHGADKNQ